MRTSSISNMKILYIFYFLGSFLPYWVRIRQQINADPQLGFGTDLDAHLPQERVHHWKTKFFIFRQCCGSGSESGSTGSTCFWASRIWIRIHQSEVWIRIRLWIRILLSLCKNSKKNLDSYYFVTLFDFLSLKNDVNVPSKSTKQKKLC